MKKLSTVVVVLALLTAGAARADDYVENQFYVEASVGHASETRQTLQAFGGGVDGTTTTKALIGGFDFTPYFGVEGGYHDYGSPYSFQLNPALLSCPQNFSCPHLTGFSAELVGRYELMPRLTVEVLSGVLHWNGSDLPTRVLSENTGNVAVYGGRLMWAATDDLSVGVRYEHSEFTTDETSLALRYTF